MAEIDGAPKWSDKWAEKQVFSTGEAAEVCRVSQQTIIRCFDNGRLGGSRVPGSRFRRIPRLELLRFMKANKIPTDALESAGRRVLIIDRDRRLIEGLRALFKGEHAIEISTAANGYDAGLLTERLRPHLILVSPGLPGLDANVVCQRVKANPDLKDIIVIILTNGLNSNELDRLAMNGADGFVAAARSVKTIAEEVKRRVTS